MLRFKEIINRLTGISTPVFGISWNPPALDVSVARETILFLEDRRVLFNPHHLEDPNHCILSIIEIREFLTQKLTDLDERSGLAPHLRAMRAACRKFLKTVQGTAPRRTQYSYRQRPDKWIFFPAIGELRGVFGIHLAQIAAKPGIDIEEDLASILPEEDYPEEEISESPRL